MLAIRALATYAVLAIFLLFFLVSGFRHRVSEVVSFTTGTSLTGNHQL